MGFGAEWRKKAVLYKLFGPYVWFHFLDYFLTLCFLYEVLHGALALPK